MFIQWKEMQRNTGSSFNVITAWKAAGVDFQTNCVFMNEAGFNAHQIRSKAWSVKGTPAIVSVPTQKGVNLSIIGCISPLGTISFSKVEPLKPADVAKIEREFPLPASKKRKSKTNDAKKEKPKKVQLLMML